MEFYRYKIVNYASMSDEEYGKSSIDIPNPSLVLETYILHKETPKGYWIGFGFPNGLRGESKWVSKTAKKRYAYPTKEEALNNFIKRTEKRVKILKYQEWNCSIALSIAERKMKEL